MGDISPSEKDSCTVPSDKIPEGENDCNCLANDPSCKVVATRHVYNIVGDTIHIHNLPLLPDCIRVSLLVAIDPKYPLPYPTDEMQMVGDALGSFVIWPSHLVMVGTLKPTKDPKPPKDPLPPKKKIYMIYIII